MKTVMVFGTFDIFHPGHVSYLKQAGKLGDKLVVVVARDKTVSDVKGRMPQSNEEVRLKNVSESFLADEVVLGSLKDKYEAIRKYRPDVIALGYDQKTDLGELSKKLEEFGIDPEIVRMKPYKPEIYKSSKLRNAGT